MTAAKIARPPKSPAFAAFAAQQIQVNEFLWSSELSYTLVERLVLTPERRAGDRGVHEVFAGLTPKPHAFVPPSKARQPSPSGKPSRRTVKYDVPVSRFELHLKADFEALCRYVIIRFHSALEHFLWARGAPFLGLDALGAKEARKRRKQYQETPYQNWQPAVERWAGLSLRSAIPRDSALLAQAHRMVRNGIVHKETDWHRPWTDAALRSAVETAFSDGDCRVIKDQLCDPVQQRFGHRKDVPVLFFYALFSLTSYRRFAEQVEAALPPPPG